MKYDFSGWATRNDLTCSDGLVIKRDAFKQQDGQTVSLVWNHQHGSQDDVLGHAVLENRDEGVYAYCTFNETESGKTAKELVKHGDIVSLSIWANQLKKAGNDVIHGCIREVSLVLAGANPGASIERVLCHSADGSDDNEELIVNYNQNIAIYHSADDSKKEEKKEDKEMAEQTEKKPENGEKTVKEVFDEMTEEQKTVVYALVGAAASEEGKKGSEDDENDDEEEEKGMKHNLFSDSREEQNEYLSHSDEQEIIKLAKKPQVGSLKTAMRIYEEDNHLQHDAVSSGFEQSGTYNVTTLFPEYKEVRPGEPELITSDQGWISKVMAKVHKSPISRIRTTQVDIRNIEALRAQGYTKGKEKKQTGNFNLVRRTTDPQTVYVKSALHRDDIVDITDFDYVNYLYKIDKMNLNEELATAIMLGDGREDGDEGKIEADKIRPIWLDDDLYCIHTDVDISTLKTELQGSNTSANFGDNYVYAEAIIQSVLYARENYKGSGTPDFYCTPHLLNVMLLARDINGRRIYSSKAELASSLNVGDIITAEQFAGRTRTTSDSKTKKLLGIICNLADYSLGATKGGEVSHFTQFDIDFNQEKSLIETRCSGALTKVWSAIALEEDVTASSTSDSSAAG